MKHWICWLLLVSFIRLQFVCCCGSMLHCVSATEAHAEQCSPCCDHTHEQAASSVKHACTAAHTKHHHGEVAASPVDRNDLQNCICDHGPKRRHEHHHLYILEHGSFSAQQITWIDSLALLQAHTWCSELLPMAGEPVAGLRAWIQPPSRVGILELLGQLRI